MRNKSLEEKNYISCKICEFNTTTKGFASHLRSAHKMTTKEYYDLYIKQENEGICPVCGKETTYYNFTKGYNKHCSTTCSSNDLKVMEKVKNTNNKKYNVDYIFQTQKCIENSHSKDSMNKRRQTLIDKYGTSCLIDYEKVKNTLMKKYNVTNAYLIKPIREKALKNAQNVESKNKKYETRKLSGWNRSNSEDKFKETMNDLGIEYKYNYKSEKYPYKCDFYIPSKDLYIELNLFWTHGEHFYTKDDNSTIELWKSYKNDYYDAAIKIWTETDIAKRDCAIKNNLNYVVLWNDNQIEQFWNDFNSGKEFISFIDYNCK